LAPFVARSDPGVFNRIDPKLDGIACKYQTTKGCLEPQGRKALYTQPAYSFKCDSL
jgi:hypothetical protein